MQTALSRIWTRVAMSIIYDRYHYTASASIVIVTTVVYQNITKVKVQEKVYIVVTEGILKQKRYFHQLLITKKKSTHNLALSWYHYYLCIRHGIFPDFSAQKLRVRIIYKNYIINFFSSHMPRHILDGTTESKLYLQTKIKYFTPIQRNIHWNVFIVCFFFS